MIEPHGHGIEAFAHQGRIATAARHLHLCFQNGERGAQLMGGIGAKALLPGHQLAQSGQLTIERLHQRPGLLPREQIRQGGKIGGVAAQDLPRQTAHRGEQPFEQQISEQQGEHHQRPLSQQGRPEQLLRQLLATEQGFRHRDAGHAVDAPLTHRLQQHHGADWRLLIEPVVEVGERRIAVGQWRTVRHGGQIVKAGDDPIVDAAHLIEEAIAHVALEAVEHHIGHIHPEAAFGCRQPLGNCAGRGEQGAIISRGSPEDQQWAPQKQQQLMEQGAANGRPPVPLPADSRDRAVW